MRIAMTLMVLAAGCSVDNEEMAFDDAVQEATARIGDRAVESPFTMALDGVDDAFNQSRNRRVGFSDTIEHDGYVAVVVQLPAMDLVLEFDVDEVDLLENNEIEFDLTDFDAFEGISVSNRPFRVPDSRVAEVVADQVPVRTFCSRLEGGQGGAFLLANAPIELNGVETDLDVQLSRYAAGSTDELIERGVAGLSDGAFGIGIGVWSTDCKRATGCNTPDCSANILGVTVTGYCSWFNTIFGKSCRCVIT